MGSRNRIFIFESIFEPIISDVLCTFVEALYIESTDTYIVRSSMLYLAKLWLNTLLYVAGLRGWWGFRPFGAPYRSESKAKFYMGKTVTILPRGSTSGLLYSGDSTRGILL